MKSFDLSGCLISLVFHLQQSQLMKQMPLLQYRSSSQIYRTHQALVSRLLYRIKSPKPPSLVNQQQRSLLLDVNGVYLESLK